MGTFSTSNVLGPFAVQHMCRLKNYEKKLDKLGWNVIIPSTTAFRSSPQLALGERSNADIKAHLSARPILRLERATQLYCFGIGNNIYLGSTLLLEMAHDLSEVLTNLRWRLFMVPGSYCDQCTYHIVVESRCDQSGYTTKTGRLKRRDTTLSWNTDVKVRQGAEHQIGCGVRYGFASRRWVARRLPQHTGVVVIQTPISLRPIKSSGK
ncbi:hypothetical protein EVAR_9541_1 [Eumeta japonica]|uniref:Uncharacterized protein n=1 Tax=Eumeta variegata TaxID=151549 RepID=A0A4C1U412_EUMVA|nr:hypothetical protein EVAR_9541_1 [Eumeta japonica]